MSSDPVNTENGNIRRVNDLLIDRAYESLLRVNGLDSQDALYADTIGTVLGKPGLETWRQRLRLTLNFEGSERTFYLKRFDRPPRRVGREVRSSGTQAGSLAGLEWTWMRRLAADGIPCARPVAFGEEIRDGGEVRSAILTESVPGDSLETWCVRWASSGAELARPLMGPLAALVGRLHARGYVHRDLYLSHVFHDPDAPPDRSLHLIDLQRVIRPQLRWLRWIIKDLAALNFSAPPNLIRDVDRRRWLTAYLRASRLDVPARSLLYRIVGKTRRIARHDRRRREALGPVSRPDLQNGEGTRIVAQ